MRYRGPKLQFATGRRIRELRRAAGMTQEELAIRVRLHANYISAIELGKRDVRISALGRIASVLGVSVAEFFAPFTDLPR